MADLQKLMAGVQDYIGKALAPIVDRLKALESKPEVIWDGEAIERALDARIPKFTPPQDGKSVTVEDVRPLIEQTVKASVDQLPKPADGKDGDASGVITELIGLLNEDQSQQA